VLITPLQGSLPKPSFIDPAGDPRLSALSVSPPFLFRNVTARVFSLKANVAVLTAFCDQYLNMDIPPTIVHYAPALPYVYLMVLNYGSMAPSSVQAQNVGWVAQHEVAFTVVLQRWREENGELVFKDWATVSPFIYVDDQLSLNTGREVYGWNKVTGVIDADIPLWVTDPAAKVRQFQLGLVDFATASGGAKDILLQIDQDPPTTFTTFPPDPRNPWSPLWAVPNGVANGASLLGGALDTITSLRIRGFEGHRSIDGLRAMAAKAREKMQSIFPAMLPSHGQAPNETALKDVVANLPPLFFENVTLKQFRNPENPDLACYQALVQSKMGVDRLNRAGLLGDVNLLRGDTSGGYRISVHSQASQPIIQTLGIEVDAWDRTPQSGGSVAHLKPILPYWLDVDLYYGTGEVICSRAFGAATEPIGYWSDEQKDAAPETPSADHFSLPLYNTALGAATQPIAGPFHFPDVTVQVYPLLADREQLAAVLKNYLNDPLSSDGMIGADGAARRGWRFETFGSYVYMMVTVYGDQLGEMWSGTNDAGDLFDREVTFTVPVKWYDENDELVAVALIEPFTFSNNGRAVATDREVNGYNSIYATIESPPDAWMTPNGPIARRSYLRLATEVIPVLNVGEKARQETLLEIDERHALPNDDTAGWGVISDTWGRVVTDELKRKTYLTTTEEDPVDEAKALALDILAHGAPINRLIVKQYRDGEHLDKACYQALVQATSTITAIYDIREMDPLVHVRVHQQPGYPLVDALGLKVKCQESRGGQVVDVLQPLRPFWMRIAAREDLATLVCYRSVAGPWQIVHPWFETPKTDPAAAPANDDPPSTPPAAAPPPKPPVSRTYFNQNGDTRVGSWLAKVPADTIPPRPSGGTLGLFPDATDVNIWLAHRSDGDIVGGNLHCGLKNAANDWLRNALINELAWIRVCIEPYRADLSEKLAGDRDAERFIACDIVPNAISDFAELYSIRNLTNIVDRLTNQIPEKMSCPRIDLPDDVGDRGPDSQPTDLPANEFVNKINDNLGIVAKAYNDFFEASTAGIRQNGLAWSWDQFLDGMITNDILSHACARFNRLPDRQQQAMMMTLPKAAYPLLEVATEFVGSPQYQFDTTFQDYDAVSLPKIQNVIYSISRIKILSDNIDNSLLDWTYPSRWRRLSRREAGEIIRQIDDVQVLIDDILSSEWENHGEHARFRNMKAGRKPTECMRLEHHLEGIARTQRLELWIDPLTGQASQFWVVAMPGQSDPIKPDADRMRLATLSPAGVDGPAPPSTTAKTLPADVPDKAPDGVAGA
jgi:hypothetical protein